MNAISRRRFLTVAGAGSVAAVVGAVEPGKETQAATGREVFTFRAVAGLPAKPFPSYASYVIEGHVDLERGTGIVTKTVFAGAPEAMSTIALPGLSRVIRITDVQDRGAHLHLAGVVDDRSQLGNGESPTVHLHLDRSRKLAAAHFIDDTVVLRLER